MSGAFFACAFGRANFYGRNMQFLLDFLILYAIIIKPLIAGLKKLRFTCHSEFEKRKVKSMYAVIVTGGKQYKVSEGDVVYVEKLGAEADAEVTFDNVLAVSNDKGIKTGKDCAKATVTAKVLKNGKAKKITVFTYKPKKNEKRKMGHRQPYTKVEITKINA